MLVDATTIDPARSACQIFATAESGGYGRVRSPKVGLKMRRRLAAAPSCPVAASRAASALGDTITTHRVWLRRSSRSVLTSESKSLMRWPTGRDQREEQALAVELLEIKGLLGKDRWLREPLARRCAALVSEAHRFVGGRQARVTAHVGADVQIRGWLAGAIQVESYTPVAWPLSAREAVSRETGAHARRGDFLQ